MPHLSTTTSTALAISASPADLLDEFRKRVIEWETIDPECDPSYEEHARDKYVAARQAIEEAFSKLSREIKAVSEMYTQITSPLQECCQRHKLGLGGELCHELVIAEVDRCRALLPTSAEARAMLNASNYSKSSDSGWKKLHSLRDGA